jgi:flavin reductase (DIM6/NTAB) family NADH-FMN oxidoreductase RutF
MVKAVNPPPLDEAIKSAEANIRQAIKQNGRYSHNIVSSSLRILAEYHGKEEANKLVDKFKLTEIYGIEKRVR